MAAQVIVALLLCLASAQAAAADVGGYQLTSENDLQGSAAAQIEKFWNDKARTGTFSGERGVTIAYATFLQPDKAAEKGAIVIVSGRTEAYLKYKELVFDLWHNGYSVYIHDHRGQGLSAREPEVAQTPQRGHVQKFSLFVSDLRTFVQQQVVPGKHGKYFLLAHSMGGAIASLYLEEDADKGQPFRAAALSSPMHQIMGAAGLPADVGICTIAHEFAEHGKSADYVVKGSDYSPREFDKNPYTRSPVRYGRFVDLYKSTPAIQLGSPTHGWVATACDAARVSRNEAAKIKVPVRLFEAAEDSIVHSNGHEVFCSNLTKTQPAGCGAKDGAPIVIPGARHELFIAPDVARNQVLLGILEFFSNH